MTQLNAHQVEAVAQADAYLNNAALPTYSSLQALSSFSTKQAGFTLTDVTEVLESLDAQPQSISVGDVTGMGEEHLPTDSAMAAKMIRYMFSQHVAPSQKSFIHMQEAIRQYTEGLIMLGELLPVLQINRMQDDALRQWDALPTYALKADDNQLFLAELSVLQREATSAGNTERVGVYEQHERRLRGRIAAKGVAHTDAVVHGASTTSMQADVGAFTVSSNLKI